jgi:hypothetical protein
MSHGDQVSAGQFEIQLPSGTGNYSIVRTMDPLNRQTVVGKQPRPTLWLSTRATNETRIYLTEHLAHFAGDC